MAIQHIAGKNKGKIMLYALSTCGWCKKTRALLESLGVEYDYEYVDLLEGEERSKAMDMVNKWNPSFSFPTIVINDQRCITGFDEDAILEAFK
jgi:glutaredoxin-like protein NrdH